jgi:hypothetical protein
VSDIEQIAGFLVASILGGAYFAALVIIIYRSLLSENHDDF